MVAFDEAVGRRLVAAQDKVLGKASRIGDEPESKPSLLTKLLDLQRDELRMVEALVDSMIYVGDVNCDQRGRSIARQEIARHLVVCRGPYEDPAQDFDDPEYDEALDRLTKALEDAGLDKRLAFQYESAGTSRMLDMIDAERAGVLAAVKRLLG